MRRLKTIIEYERNRCEALLLNCVPQAVVDELKESGCYPPRVVEQVTVLFTDFEDFTKIAGEVSQIDLIKHLTECFESFDLIVKKYNLEKIKTIGDSYMAACGLSCNDSGYAVNVINAAIEMREYIDKCVTITQSDKLPHFKIRIGIHTGPVVASLEGRTKFRYDIWGDTVNIASRMESSGEPGKINISRTTYDLIKHKFKCKPRGKIEVKSKGKLEMYWVE